jgi:hypothetical protein
VTNAPSSNILLTLRSLASAAPDDLFHGVTYWTDAQLTGIVLKYRETVRLAKLTHVPTYDENGNEQFRVFTMPTLSPGMEIDPATIVLSHATGTPHNVDFELVNEEITLSSDLTADGVYITFVFYDMYLAAAEVWDQKASHRHNYVDAKTGNQSLKLSQEYEHCLARANFYRGKRPNSFRRIKKKGYKPINVGSGFGITRRRNYL